MARFHTLNICNSGGFFLVENCSTLSKNWLEMKRASSRNSVGSVCKFFMRDVVLSTCHFRECKGCPSAPAQRGDRPVTCSVGRVRARTLRPKVASEWTVTALSKLGRGWILYVYFETRLEMIHDTEKFSY